MKTIWGCILLEHQLDENKLEENLLAKNWDEVLPWKDSPRLYAKILQLNDGYDCVQALSALLVRGMDPQFLDLCIRDLAWKRRLTEVDGCLSLGGTPVWAAVGFALYGDLALADQYWSSEFALEGSSWRGPLLAALASRSWAALPWMVGKGADLRWLFEEDALIGDFAALEVIFQAMPDVNLIDWDVVAHVLGLSSWQITQYWSVDKGIFLDSPLSQLQLQTLDVLIKVGYRHPELWVLLHRQSKLQDYKARFNWQFDHFLSSDYGRKILVRLFIQNPDLENLSDWLNDLRSLGFDFHKVLSQREALFVLCDELMNGSLERLKVWWPHLLIYGLGVQDLLHSVLKHRRIGWVSWVLELGQIDRNSDVLQNLLLPYPPSFRVKFGFY